MKVDLQNVDDVQGYQIIEELAEYNAKSHSKAYYATHRMVPVVVVV